MDESNYTAEGVKGTFGPNDKGIDDHLTFDDPINKPSHYTSHPSGVECITITESMDFLTGNVIKYIWRSNDKYSKIQDLKKAQWYLNRLIEREEKTETG